MSFEEPEGTKRGGTPKPVVLMELEIARWEAELILMERIADHKRDTLQGHIDRCAAKILKHYEQAEERRLNPRPRPSRAKK